MILGIIILMAFLWLIGFLFSVGICFDDTKGWDGFGAALLMLIFWPLFLGCILRENLGWTGK